MSNQRSEQPVAVCPFCNGTADKPNKIADASEGHIAYNTCRAKIHSSTEQGMTTIEQDLEQFNISEQQAAAQKFQVVAAEFADLRRQLAERDAVIERCKKTFLQIMPDNIPEAWNAFYAILSSASPSTILESVRQAVARAERRRCAEIVDSYHPLCDSDRPPIKWETVRKQIAAAIRQNPEAEKEKKA